MAPIGFFDPSDCYASLDGTRDSLVEIDAVLAPGEEFRPMLEGIWRTLQLAGRPSRESGARLSVGQDGSLASVLRTGLPDAKIVWLYREASAQAGLIKMLFKQLDGSLARQGYIARGRQILDASIVPVPRNRNTRDESKAIKNVKVPVGWAEKHAKRSQKDVDAVGPRSTGNPTTATRTM